MEAPWLVQGIQTHSPTPDHCLTLLCEMSGLEKKLWKRRADWEKAIAVHAMQGTRASSRGEGGSLMDFLELRQARGVYSRVATWRPILNGSLFRQTNKVSTLV